MAAKVAAVTALHQHRHNLAIGYHGVEKKSKVKMAITEIRLLRGTPGTSTATKGARLAAAVTALLQTVLAVTGGVLYRIQNLLNTFHRLRGIKILRRKF